MREIYIDTGSEQQALRAAHQIISGDKLTSPAKDSYEGVEIAVLREAIRRKGIGVWVPRQYLFGTQTIEEYDAIKRKVIEEKLLRFGMACLEAEPLLACAISYKYSTSLAILDGHHKARYSSKYNICMLPCLIASPEVYVNTIKNHNPQAEINTDSFVRKLEDDAAATIRSFSSRMREKYIPPTLIPGVSDPEQLKAIFTPLNAA